MRAVDVPVREDLTLFLASELRLQPSRLVRSARLLHDLGVDGDDGCELIRTFGKRFEVDISAFDPSLHFGHEAGPNPLIWLWWTITRTWPRLTPITVGDLEASIARRRWTVEGRNAV